MFENGRDRDAQRKEHQQCDEKQVLQTGRTDPAVVISHLHRIKSQKFLANFLRPRGRQVRRLRDACRFLSRV